MKMDKIDIIQQEVEKTLQSLDGLQRAEANPFLFTRIKARMQKNSPWERITSFVSRPAIALAGLFLIMLINAFVVFSSGDKENGSTEIAATDIADEYNLATSTNYEYENLEEK